MRLLLSFLIILFALNLFAQRKYTGYPNVENFSPLTMTAEASDVFLLLKHKVKSKHFGKYKIDTYEYNAGEIIIRNERLPLERYYYYSKIGQFDSIICKETQGDSVYVDKILYRYNYKDQLVKIDKISEKITKDTFMYNSDGLIEKIESYVPGGSFDDFKLTIQSNYFYTYNYRNQLIECKITGPPWLYNETYKKYRYNTKGLLIEVETSDNTGCSIVKYKGEKDYTLTKIGHDQNGLFLTSEVVWNVIIGATGEIKLIFLRISPPYDFWYNYNEWDKHQNNTKLHLFRYR